MKRTLILAALCVCGSLAGAQEASRDRLGAACRDLEAGDPKRAFAAVQAITALGGAALPAIEERAKEAKGRVRDYLELAAEEIRNAPYLPGYPAVKRVTMKATDRNVVELLSDLKAKTGLPLSLDSLIDDEKLPEIPVEVRDVTVLEAFDAICHAGNVTVSMDNGQLTLFTGAYVDQPRFFFGHYYFRLGEFDVTKLVSFRKPAFQRFNIRIEMIWDPVVSPARFRPVRILEAVDDRGKSLLLPPHAPGGEAADDDEGPDSSIHLLPPSAAATKLTLLRGYMPVVLPKTKAGIVVENPAEGLTVPAGDLTCRILGIDGDQRSMALHVSSKKLKPEALEELDYSVKVNLKGWESSRAYVTKTSRTEHAVELLVHFEPLTPRDVPPRPVDETPPALKVERMELTVVTSTQDKRIPFEFKDLKIK